MNRLVYSIIVTLMLVATSASAQPIGQSVPSAQSEDRQEPSTMHSPGKQEDMGAMAGGETQDMSLSEMMSKMATTVTRMAEVCEQMMQREMAIFSYKIAGGIIVGILATVTLLLLVVLEVQWIIYWGRLLREKKRK